MSKMHGASGPTTSADEAARSSSVRRLMLQAGCPLPSIDIVERQVAALRVDDPVELISDSDIAPAEPQKIDPGGGRPDVEEAFRRLAVIRLNGGLGTSMGMERAKSLLPVRGGLTFLDVIVRQILDIREITGARLPVTFLHSFRTSADCLRLLDQYDGLQVPGVPLELMQHRIPKLGAVDLEPVHWPPDPELEWCPPGHGDIYTVLHTTGFLDRLDELGIDQVFIGNVDNLGAVPEPDIAAWFAQSGAPFAVEVVRRTANDRKGGHFAVRRTDRQLILRETAQTPADDVACIARHPFASTNNIWFDVAAMRSRLNDVGGDLDLPLIVNRKTVDPSDAGSPAVVQLETAMGAAVQVFDAATTVEVDRDRFIPVKTTDDLLIVRSDCYRLIGNRLVCAASTIPVVRLGEAYRRIDDFDERFPHGPPSLLGATSFIVRGDWTVRGGVRVVGDVELGPQGGVVDDGTTLEGRYP